MPRIKSGTGGLINSKRGSFTEGISSILWHSVYDDV
jgi:hypothetical protein